MFYVSKQQIYNFIFSIALIVAIGVNFFTESIVDEASGPLMLGKIIVIDAGHGAPDGGAVGIGGSIEKDLNLEVAKLLGKYLEQSGALVIYTRNDDNSVAYDIEKNIKNLKKSDLVLRKEIKNKSGADMFISIHMNKFDDPQYKGAQVFYNGKSQDSRHLAEYIQENLKKLADDSNTRQSKDDNNSIYVLKDSKIPSVLVECGFLSNPIEEKD